MRDPYLIALVWTLAINIPVLAVWCVVFWKTAKAAAAAESACERLSLRIGGMRHDLAGLDGELRLAGLDDLDGVDPMHDYT